MKALVNNVWDFEIGPGTVNGQPVVVDFVETGSDALHFLLNEAGYTVLIKSVSYQEKTISLSVNGRDYDVLLKSHQDVLLQKLGLQASAGRKVNQLKAPMPGLLLSVLVKEGDNVSKGGPLCLLEAMKMENVLKAPADLVIRKISVTEKQAVEKGQVLMEFN